MKIFNRLKTWFCNHNWKVTEGGYMGVARTWIRTKCTICQRTKVIIK